MPSPISSPTTDASSAAKSEPLGAQFAQLWAKLQNRGVTLLLFLAAAFVAYAPALSGELIWDDAYLVGENPFFRSPIFVWEVFRHYLFFDSFSTYYRPVQNWSYMLDYWLWRGEPMGYHVTNVLLHTLSAFLAWRLFRRLLPPLLAGVRDPRLRQAGPAIAWAVAFVWLIHPMHSAAVAYISGRADSLASLFALTAWLATIRLSTAHGAKRALLGAVAALCLLLALCSKEIALVWIGLFTLHLVFFDRQTSWRQRGALFGGIAAVFAAYAWLHSLPAPRVNPEAPEWSPLADRVLLALRALGDYTSIIFYPGRLTMDRSLAHLPMYRGAFAGLAQFRLEHLAFLGGGALAACAYFCARGKSRRLLLFAAGWFFIAFLPISNLFPLNAEVAEHWIYLASLGFLLFAAVPLASLAVRWPRVAGTLAAAAVAALVGRTAFRAYEWADQERFLKATISSGGATSRVLNNLGSLYASRGDYVRQEQVLRRTLALFPGYPLARVNLGACLMRQNRLAEAQQFLAAELGDHADNATASRQTWRAAVNLARTQQQAGKAAAALDLLQQTQRDFGDVWEPVGFEAQMRREKDGPAAAIPLVERYAAANWWHRDSWLSLARLHQEAGHYDAACAAYAHASRLDIYDSAPLAGLARTELARHHARAAIAAQRRAIARAPERPSHYLELSRLFDELGLKNESAEAERKAAQLASLAL